MKINQPKFTGTEIDAMLNPGTVLNAVEDLRRQRAAMSPNNLASAVKRGAGLEVEVTESSDGLMFVVREPGHKYGTAVPIQIYRPFENGVNGWYVPGTATADHRIVSIDCLPTAELTSDGWVARPPMY